MSAGSRVKHDGSAGCLDECHGERDLDFIVGSARGFECGLGFGNRGVADETRVMRLVPMTVVDCCDLDVAELEPEEPLVVELSGAGRWQERQLLVDPKSKELEVAAASGLSSEYLNKGPLNSIRSIGQSLKEGPVAIYNVRDDPRIQYPKAAQKEGIASILAVPIFIRGNVIGCMRVYSSEPWEFTLEDVNFVQALAQIAGVLIDMCRLYQGQREYIDVLMDMREARAM